MTRHRLGPGIRFDLATAVDGLRKFLGRANAQGRAAEDLIERDPWDDVDVEDRWERLAHLVSGMLESLQVAIVASGEIADELAKHSTGAAHAAR